ncbi:major facilitator superfamily domain-containing protein [Talaromyces proteolyticus]|uniref:Major facilitator superfamily domain-containing protein n=1 Tax=Talaromyces proteolyticus TaxID=1131652 RepID=A0AAD4Q0L1_9EURO|nr:major facilitator superfamily domain-containing protein [Talaromyces proteolyticus]KAH8704223.1 major facilitator superfamily domain-containing protein [Talaromyces proteolyticus]
MSVDDGKARDEVHQGKKRTKFVGYLWDTFDKPPAERRLLTKLDAAILSFGAVGYFVKSVDQYNINNAFVSGMKEDLGLYQNQLNYIQTAWSLGYMLGQIPSNIILSRVRPRYWIPSLEVCWSVLTLSLSRCNRAYQFYIIRFLVGLCESGYYPGIQHSLGSWYRRDELGKRACILQMCSAVGQMVSGYMMGGVYHLGGVGGHKGWQWAYIIDGSLSLPMAIAGYFLLPDVPEITKSWYLSEEEIKLSQLRMQLEGRKPRSNYTKQKMKRIFSSWHIYLLSLLYVAFNNGSTNTQPVFQQYLGHSEHPKYTVSQINNYSTTTSALQVLMTLIYAWLSDTILRGRRWPPLVFGGVVNIICYVSLAVWDIPKWWKWTCFIASGASYGLGGLCMAWANEVCEDDSEERAITIAAMNEVAYILQIWLPLIVWQQVEAPRYFKGYVTVSFMSVLLIIMCFIVRRLHNREISTRKSHAAGTSPQDDEIIENTNGAAIKTNHLTTDSSIDLIKSETLISSDSSSSSPVSRAASSKCSGEYSYPDRIMMTHFPADSVVNIEMETRPSKMI